MSAPRRFPVAELVRRSRTPRATIHHYLKSGLLPEPERSASNRFLYDRRHVDRLRLIGLLRRRRGLRLDAIRAILPDLDQLEGQEAFRPEMWEQVLATRPAWSSPPASRLLDAATDAFARHGYADVNVDELCRGAGIAKGSFYRHFASKEALFFAVADGAARQMGASFTPGQDPEGAGRRLGELLAPRAWIFLDLVSRAIEGRPGYRAAGRTILLRLAADIGRSLGATDPEEAGLRAIFGALALATGSALRERPAHRAARRP